MTTPGSWTALELAAAIRAKDVSPVEAARAYLEAVDEHDGKLNAFTWRRDEELLAEARLAEAAVMRGDELAPFHGVPIPIKDLTEVQGHPTTQGSVAAKDKVGRWDNATVTRLKQAGFLIMGRTNSPEFGTLPVTENTLYGATRNPWDLSRTPGGSSGGAAAAVAKGMAPIAHASDGGGSIRIPASCCGLVGLKATRGRIPKGPWASDIMHGFTTDGVVSMDVADQAAALDALACDDPTGWWGLAMPQESFASLATSKPPRLRIGVAHAGPLGITPEPSCVEAVTRAASILADLGHHVDEAQVDWRVDPQRLAKDFLAVWCTGAAYNDVPDWTKIEPLNAGLRELSKQQSSHDYIQAVMRLQVFSRRLVQTWGESFDLLLMPTMAIEPPPIGWMFATGLTDPEALLWRATEMVPNTGWCNVTGQPAISLPVHVAKSGGSRLPIGVQLTAAPRREDLLLQVGMEIEAALGWRASLPVGSPG
jgi:amidase